MGDAHSSADLRVLQAVLFTAGFEGFFSPSVTVTRLGSTSFKKREDSCVHLLFLVTTFLILQQKTTLMSKTEYWSQF